MSLMDSCCKKIYVRYANCFAFAYYDQSWSIAAFVVQAVDVLGSSITDSKTVVVVVAQETYSLVLTSVQYHSSLYPPQNMKKRNQAWCSLFLLPVWFLMAEEEADV